MQAQETPVRVVNSQLASYLTWYWVRSSIHNNFCFYTQGVLHLRKDLHSNLIFRKQWCPQRGIQPRLDLPWSMGSMQWGFQSQKTGRGLNHFWATEKVVSCLEWCCSTRCHEIDLSLVDVRPCAVRKHLGKTSVPMDMLHGSTDVCVGMHLQMKSWQNSKDKIRMGKAILRNLLSHSWCQMWWTTCPKKLPLMVLHVSWASLIHLSCSFCDILLDRISSYLSDVSPKQNVLLLLVC